MVILVFSVIKNIRVGGRGPADHFVLPSFPPQV